MRLELNLQQRDQTLSDLQIKLERTTQLLEKEIEKHKKPVALSASNIDERLTKKSQEILESAQNKFGNVIEILQTNLGQQGIDVQRLDVTGSQVYVPLLKMLGNIQFKDDGEPQDLDLCLVIPDEKFDQNFTEDGAKEMIEKLLPNFKIVGMHHLKTSPHRSTSIKLKFEDQEIDLNIYGESSYGALSQWQFNADRMRLDCKTQRFEINNNEATNGNIFEDCSKFLLALQDKEIDLWKHNHNAKGFLNRIVKDCGRLKLSPGILDPIQETLSAEMDRIVNTSQPNGFRVWEVFKKHHCTALDTCSRSDELAMVKTIHKLSTAKTMPRSYLDPILTAPNSNPHSPRIRTLSQQLEPRQNFQPT